MTACFLPQRQRRVPIFGDSGPVLLALTVGIFAPLTSWAATRRARNPVVWFALGACSGPMALFILAVAPPGRCPDCDRPVRGWNRACARCGARFPPIWEEEEPRPAEAYAASPVPAARPSNERPAMASRARALPAAEPAPAAAAPASRPSRRSRRARPKPAEPDVVAPADAPMPPAEPDPVPQWAPLPAAPPPQPAPRPPAPVPVFRDPVRVPERPPRRADAPLADAEVRMLATGIYILGNAGLEVGARYALASVGDRLRVFGPVDLGAVTVRHERRIADLEVTGMGDQLIISATRGSGLAMVFQGLGGMAPAELERVLSQPDPTEGRSGVLPS